MPPIPGDYRMGGFNLTLDDPRTIANVTYIMQYFAGNTSGYSNLNADMYRVLGDFTGSTGSSDGEITIADVTYFMQNFAGNTIGYPLVGQSIIISAQGPTRQQRTFPDPPIGIKFTAAYYTPTDLIENTYSFDISNTISSEISQYWHQKTQDVSFSKPEDKGITVITVQTISNENFTNYLGAHTLQFSNWDFSANNPEDPSGVGTNGKNIFKSYNNISDSSANWDPSATMLVGIPTNYSNNYDIVDISHVAFPVAITTSHDPPYNVISYTQDNSASFIDLYAVLGRPKIENVIAYNENLVQISDTDLSWVTISGEAASSASIIHTNPLRSIQQSNPVPKPIIPKMNVEQSKPVPKPIIPRTNIQQTPKILLPPFTGPSIFVR